MKWVWMLETAPGWKSLARAVRTARTADMAGFLNFSYGVAAAKPSMVTVEGKRERKWRRIGVGVGGVFGGGGEGVAEGGGCDGVA